MDKVVLKKALKYAASKGKGKDTILAHLNPREVELLKKHGGSGTKNEHTGLYQFDSESGGEGPGAEGGAGAGGGTGGPGTGADPGEGGPSGQGGQGQTEHSAEKTAAAGPETTATNASEGKGIFDVLGIPPEVQQMINIAGKVPTSLIGVPNFAGIASTVNSMSKHGVDQPSNPGGNVSAASSGMGMGAGAATDPGGNGPGPAGSGGSMGGNINGMPFFGQAPPPTTTAQRGVAGLSPAFGPNFTGPSFGAPPPTSSAQGGFGTPNNPYKTPVLQPNIRRF